MARNSPIIIEQVLHGYSQGHSLISTSVNLTPEVKRIMLPMSDMSGNRMLGGFEQYISGYPLNDMGVFAIAKTWYADEMKRPGCVWTHSLLIQFADLPRIYDLDGLLELFRRPAGPEGTDGYDTKLTLEQVSFEFTLNKTWLEAFSPQFVKETLYNLYGFAGDGVFIKTAGTDKYDRFCLALWQQQWPRLRRSFSFSSGSIEPRSLNRKLLDLQVVPARTTTPAENVRIIDPVRKSSSKTEEFEEWVHEIYNDLHYPSLLRDFLNTYGADVPAAPQVFQLLAESYLLFSGERNKLEEVVNFLALKFPSNKEASTLKMSILQEAEEGGKYFLPKYKEEEILFVLATTKKAGAFDYDKLAFEERVVQFFLNDKVEAIRLLNSVFDIEPNEYGESAIKAIASVAETTNINDLSWSESGILSVLVSLNPRLTYSEKFWMQNASSEAEIIRFLQRNVDSSQISWKTIVEILLQIGSFVSPRMIEQSFPELVQTMLDWVNEADNHLLTAPWFNHLESNPVLVLKWLEAADKLSDRLIELCLKILDPNSAMVVAAGFQPWYRLLSSADFVARNIYKEWLKCFGLALAFNLDGEEAILLFRECFETAYMMLYYNKMPAVLWNDLEPHTPTIARYQNWDKCKRLVRGIVDEIISKQYDIYLIVDAFQSVELRDRVIRRYWKVK